MDDAARSSRRCTKDSVRTVFDSPDFASSQSRIHTHVRCFFEVFAAWCSRARYTGGL